ncbi:MAG: hypothetical protein JNM94_06365 [Phycisphaerae bacterium]|nr:hypothetical protein [Phycisphaerae bacterium]
MLPTLPSLALLLASLAALRDQEAPPPAPAATSIAPAAASSVTDGYRASAALNAAVRAIAAANPSVATLEVIGKSGRGTDILALTLRGSGSGQRPAMLVVGGLDGAHLASAETAVRVAERLAAKPEALANATVYVIACANPDALDASLAVPTAIRLTSRPVDDDRDGAIDEDGPKDLDGDGVITSMRVKNPKPPYQATLVPDAKVPALMKAPDAAKGELPLYAVFVEGVDADADGRIAEDGPGGVDLNRNFPHRYPEFAPDAGPHQISEPESKALADFVIAKPDILAAIVYGRHDTLVQFPDTRDMDSTGRTPLVYNQADHATYQELAKLYKETTGQSRATTSDPAGSFWLWLANHRGVLTVASSVWGRPDLPKPPEPPPPPPAPPPAPPAPANAEHAPEADAPRGRGPFQPEPQAAQGAPVAPAAPATQAPGQTPPGDAPRGPRGGGRGGRGGRPGGGGGPAGAPASPAPSDAKPADEESAAWLEWIKSVRNGAGFVEWHEVEHPLFGTVEVGGFHPLVRTAPPAADLDVLAEKQAAFVVAVLERFPKIVVEPITVTTIADGVYRIETAVANVGRLPTSTRMGRTTEKVDMVIARVSTPVERVLSGQRVRKIDGLDPGQRETLAWIVQAPKDETVDLTVAWGANASTNVSIRDGKVVPNG